MRASFWQRHHFVCTNWTSFLLLYRSAIFTDVSISFWSVGGGDMLQCGLHAFRYFSVMHVAPRMCWAVQLSSEKNAVLVVWCAQLQVQMLWLELVHWAQLRCQVAFRDSPHREMCTVFLTYLIFPGCIVLLRYKFTKSASPRQQIGKNRSTGTSQ